MFQDWSTSRVMASIKGMLPEDCLVVRDGETVSAPAHELVPGDIVLVKAGNKLPADLRFLQVSSDARFDRAVLTGESVPLAATVDSTDENYLETKCIGLQGTHCTSGNCTGLVVSTGDKTVFGRIAQLTNEPKTKMTTLEREILYFVLVICGIMLSMICLVLILWSVTMDFSFGPCMLMDIRCPQGSLASERPPRLDQRPDANCRLCIRRYRLHSRGSADCGHCRSHHHGKYHAQAKDPLQVAEDS